MYKSNYQSFFTVLIVCWCNLSLAETLPDPTRPPGLSAGTTVTGKTVSPAYQLSSILIAQNRRSAVINDKPVQIGTEVNGAQVMAIEANYVKLRKNGREWALTLLPDEIKNMAHGVHNQ